MGMPQIVNANALHASRRRAPIHFVVQKALGKLKDPILLFQTVDQFQIILHLLAQERRHFYDTVTLFRLRGSDDVLAVQTLIGLIDIDRTILEIKIPGS